MKKKSTPIIASVSGVRGILGDNLTPENITGFTSAFAEYCRARYKTKTIVIGRDGRAYGDIIYSMVISTLFLAGFKVIHIGVVPTPTVQIATEETEACGGISLSASHNPQKWNGLKFLNPDGTFLDAEAMEEIKKIAFKKKFYYAPLKELYPPVPDSSWSKKHIEKVLKMKILDLKKIRKRKFKVVVDAVNSSGSLIVPELLCRLGCEVIELYTAPTGVFPHTPEPVPENLTDLCQAVIKHKADLGVAVDPDADRLVLITDKGEPFIEENTITTVINHIFRKHKSQKLKATVNLSTTRAVDDIAKEYKGKIFRTPVGEINVVKAMVRNKSICGGEGSGGVIISPAIGGHYGRDSLFGIAVILNELADANISLSKYKENLPKYKIEKTKLTIKDPSKFLRDIVRNNKKVKDCKITEIDGVKLDFKDFWVHFRKSNTEPVVRIIKETKIEK